MSIVVKPDGRILVNQIQNGVQYSSVTHANMEAQKLHDTHYPQATLILCKPETETK
jgi:hypothetical protein